MDSTNERRRLLGAFLRAQRERLTPAEAGVNPGFTRRRTPGLRREEVAQICGLSPTWYTWMEQGRDVSASPSALARLAAGLHLTAAERAYLFELSGKRDPDGASTAPQENAPPALLSALEAISAPAYLLDRLWNACAANTPAKHLLREWLGGAEPNLLRYVFLDPGAKTFICDWENRGRRLVAEFRADTSRYAGDAEIFALVGELSGASPLFARYWGDHGVLEREGGARAFRAAGGLIVRYEQITLTPPHRAGYKLVMLLPALQQPAEFTVG